MKVQGHERQGMTHERRDADVINLTMIALMLFLVITLCLLVCWILLRYFNGSRQVSQPPQLRMIERVASFPQPQLIKEPGSERRQVSLAEETRLKTYGWVDRPAGVAHIPIARAMQLLVERGLPEVGAGQTRLQLLQSRPQTMTPLASPVNSATPQPSP